MARADGSADGLEDVFGSEWKWWYHRNRWQALFFRVRQADGTISGFRGPELLIDVGDLAIWAMGADGRAITKQEAALTVLRAMVMLARANGDGAGGAGEADGLLEPELQDRSRADVGLPATGARLCGLVGTDQPGGNGDEHAGSTDRGRREGEARGGGFERADTANRFPGSELQVESRTGVARAAAMADCGINGGSMMSGRQQGNVGHGSSLGVQAAGCFPGPELRVGSGWIGRDGRYRRPDPKAAADSRRRWEARWAAREVREKAARAQKLAAQDQGNKTGPTQAGPCAACARQGGICGFCRERQRLAC